MPKAPRSIYAYCRQPTYTRQDLIRAPRALGSSEDICCAILVCFVHHGTTWQVFPSIHSIFSQWRYVHLLFFVAFLGSWFLFALLWWLIIYYHGDFEEEHLPENQVFCIRLSCLSSLSCLSAVVASTFARFPTNIPLFSQVANNWTPCVWQINNFASVFLFR